MLNTATVFILGAGASKPYGLPLGGELYRSVLNDFGPSNQSTPLRDAVRHLLLNASGFSTRHIEPFVETLRYSGLTSVDAFLERRLEFVDVGKAIMAVELLGLEDHEKLWNSDENWMQYLYARLTTDTLDQFRQNEVSFITYNYDRTLEHFLHTSLKNTYGKDDLECAAVLKEIPIIHLHGRLGYLPWQSHKDMIPFGMHPIDSRILDICQKGIRIVHEDITDRDDDFKFAKGRLAEAKRIYFMGFGYGSKNVARLNIADFRAGIIEGTAQGVSPREQMTIKGLFQDKVHLYDMDCLTFLRDRAELD